MSQIDQAFIQAYSSEAPPATPASHPHSIRQPAPRLFQDQPPAANSYEMDVHAGVRSPHVDFSSGSETAAHDPRAEIAALQQSSVAQAMPSGVQSAEAPSTPRQPLSSFAAAQKESTNSFRPVFEVDAFRWPAVTTNLLQQHASMLAPIAEELISSSEAGRSMVAIAGARHCVGATTIQLSLARMLAAAEKEVAIVDGDFATRAMAKALGLEFGTGWEDVLTGQVPLAEGVVHSIQDNISLLPLAGRDSNPVELLAGIQASISAGVLRYHYDVVLIDFGDAGRQPQWPVAQKLFEQCRIDSSIIVADAAHSNQTMYENIDPLMNLFGNTCLGVIGNSTVSPSIPTR